MTTLSLTFTATIEKDGTYPTSVTVPDSKTFFGTGRPVKVVGTVDGHDLEATLMPSGHGGHWLPLRQAVCAATGKSDAGDEVDVVLRPVPR